MLFNQLNKLAVSLVDDLTSTTVISNVSEGVDESSSFMYDVDYEEIEIEDEQPIPFKAMHEVTAIGLVREGINLLDLNDPEQETHFASIGHNMALISLEPVRVEFLDHPDTGNFWRFHWKKQSVPYRERTSKRRGAGLHVGANLLSVYQWIDADSDGVAEGWDASDFSSATFSNGVQTLSGADAVVSTYGFSEIFFPFSGEELTFSVSVDALTANGHDIDIQLEFFDDTDTLISTESTVIGSTGRKFIKANIPQNAVFVKPSIVSDGTAGTGASSIELSDPALRVDGKTEYTLM